MPRRKSQLCDFFQRNPFIMLHFVPLLALKRERIKVGSVFCKTLLNARKSLKMVDFQPQGIKNPIFYAGMRSLAFYIAKWKFIKIFHQSFIFSLNQKMFFLFNNGNGPVEFNISYFFSICSEGIPVFLLQRRDSGALMGTVRKQAFWPYKQ